MKQYQYQFHFQRVHQTDGSRLTSLGILLYQDKNTDPSILLNHSDLREI